MSLVPRARNQVFIGTFIHSKTRTELEYLHNAAVGVDKLGKIVHIEKSAALVDDANPDNNPAKQTQSSDASKHQLLKTLGWREDDVDVVEAADGQFFFPGFIDTHIHAPQYPNAGLFGKSTLLDWLETYTFPLEASLSSLPKARRAYTSCVRRTLAHGTTTAAYYATIDVAATNLLADLCLSAGQRAFVGRVCMDNADMCPAYYRDESVAASLAATRATIDHIRAIDPHHAVVSPILTPRFAPACSPAAMRGLRQLHDETGLPLQTHISENVSECRLVDALFPDAGSYAAAYDRHGLLTPRTVLAHAVHLSEDEARLVAARESKVSHCPCSNSCLTSGEARVRWLWAHGITVGLGTDVSGGSSPSVLEAARLAALVSRHVAMKQTDQGDDKSTAKLSVEEVLYLATRGGAQCLGLEAKLGAFQVGMEWDAQLVALRTVPDAYDDGCSDPAAEDAVVFADEGNVDIFGWESWEERIAKWLYNGDDRNSKMVWVKGRLVHARRS